MKILFVVFHFPPISGGGVVVIVDLANTLVKLGHQVTVITPDLEWQGEKFNPILNSSIKIIKTKTPSASNLKIAARRCLPSIKQKVIETGKNEEFDFILTIFHPFHLVPKAAISAGKQLRLPVLIKIDDAIYEKSSGLKSIQRKIEKIYNTRTLKSASKLLVSNKETMDVVNQNYNIEKNKISIISNGVDLSKFYRSKSKSKNIIFTGAMYHHRGLDVLLDAIPEIIKKHKDSRFILIGNGPEKQKLEKITIEKKISEFVYFEEWIDREDIPKKLADSIIGIGPLRLTAVTKGALPIKVLEYMASSLPIIAQNGTLPADILEDGRNGFFIKNAQELAEKINHLLDNEDIRESFGTKSKEMVKKFDWENIANDIIKEFKNVINSHNK